MKRTISAVVIICLCVVLLINTFGFAWMSDRGLSSPIDITSNLRKSYFESGEGTAEAPFEIKYPVQLYYFTWLQYLGYFNEKDENGKIETLYFRVSENLDMSGYTLPPVGTMNNPFLGNFDGEGHTISNLTIENAYKPLTEPPNNTLELSGVEIIGFFGVIGALGENPGYSYDSSANQVSNLLLKDITVNTQTGNALIGLVAGYVNGDVDCVGVVGSTVNINAGTQPLGYTDNISDYALVGYCTAHYRDTLYQMNIDLSDPNLSSYTVVPPMSGNGNENGWGGSVKMESIYGWLTKIKKGESVLENKTSTINYIWHRIDLIDLNENIETIDRNNTESKIVAEQEGFGSFVFSTKTSVDYVNFVSGSQKVTEYKFSYDEKNKVFRYYITDGTNYLSFNGNSLINTDGSDESNTTEWYMSNGASGGIVYAVHNGRIYYLSINNSALTIEEINTVTEITNFMSGSLSKWTVSNNDLVMNSQKLEYTNDSWTVVSSTAGTAKKYLISSAGNPGNYLSANGTTGVKNVTNAEEATKWEMNLSGSRTTISTVIDGTTYNLYRSSSSISLSNRNSTNWTYDKSNNWLNSVNYYLIYDSSSSSPWQVKRNPDSNLRNLTIEEYVESHDYAQPIATSQEANASSVSVEARAPYVDNSVHNSYYDANGDEQSLGAGITYFPLSSEFDENGKLKVSANNTGYIIGSEWDKNATDRDTQDNNPSNLRISAYTDTGNTDYIKNEATPYVISHKTKDQLLQVPAADAYDADTLKEEYGVFKYAGCYNDYYTSVKNGVCYGLHFMDAPILKQNVTEITAYFSGKNPIDKYQLPTNCIDFSLYESGFINAFAGTYYMQGKTNDSFFSLYQIFRDSLDENGKKNERIITDIKEIYQIYGVLTDGDIDTKYEYAYTYIKDGVISGTEKIAELEEKYAKLGKQVKYTVVFDCEWINNTEEQFKNKGWSDYTSYYFEIPVNAGEYAIGSTEGKTGAYLVYLDLAANAQQVERTRVDEKIVIEERESSVPAGISILKEIEKVGDEEVEYNVGEISSDDGAFVSIPSKQLGQSYDQATFIYPYEKDGEVVNGVIKDTAKDHEAVYVGFELELWDGNDKAMAIPVTRTTTVERSTYYDFNTTTEESTVTVLTTTTTVEGGVTTGVNYTLEYVITNKDGSIKEQDSYDGPDKPTLKVPDAANSPQNKPFENSLLNAKYVTSDKENFKLDFQYTPATESATPVYLVTLLNDTDKDTPVAISLTPYGVSTNVTFKINNGGVETTLPEATDKIIFTSKKKAVGG